MNIFEESETGFVNTKREDLEQYARIIGVELKGNLKDDTLRQRLLEKLGKQSMIAMENNGPVEAAEFDGVGITDIDELFKLNLTGRGKWEGRRRKITVARPDAYEGKLPQFVKWGRQAVWIRYDEEVSVPYPIWNILKDAKPKRLFQRRSMGEDGMYRIQNQFKPYDRFRISDHGDDPATRDLPVNQKHQYRALAKMTNGFTQYKGEPISKGQLLMLADRVRSLKPNRMRDWDQEAIRAALLGYVGEQVGLAAA